MDFRAIIFVPALVGAAICVFIFLTYAAHYYLTVLEGTAAGAKHITWFSDSIIESFWKPFYLAALLCIWLGPAYVLGRFLAGKLSAPWLVLGLPVFVAWALYPVSQLSSLSASSVWVPLHPQVFARLAQKPAVLLGFYFITLPVFALAGLAFNWAFLTADRWELLFLGVPLMVLCGLLYARILGRLAFALMFTRDVLKRRKKRPKLKPKRARLDQEVSAHTVLQPSELPPINTPEGELAGYDVLISDTSPAPRPRVVAEVAEEETDEVLKLEEEFPATALTCGKADSATGDDEDATPYVAQEPELPSEERMPGSVIKPSAEEMELLERSDVPRAPRVVWNTEVFAFLSQQGTISAMAVLCTIAMLAGIAVRVARMFNPVAGSE